MPYFVLYTALLLLGCFFVGAWLACILRKFFGSKAQSALQTAGAVAGAGAIAATRVAEPAPDVAASGSLFGERDASEQTALDQVARQDDPVPAPELVVVDSVDIATSDQNIANASEGGVVEARAKEGMRSDEDGGASGDDASQVVMASDQAVDSAVDNAHGSGSEEVAQEPSPVADVEEDVVHAEASTDVASAVAAASAAAAAAVAAAKAGVASARGEAEAETELTTPSVVATAPAVERFEEILPSPDADGFVLPETDVATAPALAVDASLETVPPSDDAGVLADAGDVASVDEQVEDRLVAEPEPEPEPEPEQAEAGHNTALASAMAAAAAAAGLATRQASDEIETEVQSEDLGKADDDGAVVAASVAAEPDDLTRIKGIDDEVQDKLHAVGLTSLTQMAALTSGQVSEIDANLGSVGRVSRQGWIEQATILSSGRETYYSKREYRKATGSRESGSGSGAPGNSGGSGSPSRDRGERVFAGETSSATAAQTIATGVAAVGGIAGAAISAAPPSVREETVTVSREAGAEREPRPEREARAEREPRPEREARAEREPRPEREARAERGSRPDREPRADRPEREDRASRVDQERDVAREESETEKKGGAFGSVSERLRGGRKVRSIPGVGNPERRRVGGGGQMLSSSEPDDLKRIRGVGVVIEKKLNAMGVTSYAEIAKWSQADIEKVNSILDFSGRIERENWIEQARALTDNA